MVLVYSKLCKYYHCLILAYSHCFPKGTQYLLAVTPYSSPLPPSSRQSQLYPPLQMDLPVLDISCTLSQTMCGIFCDWLLSLSMFSNFIYVVAWISTSFLLWLNNIPLYEQTTFCLPVHQLMDVWVVSSFGLSWIELLWTFICVQSVYVNTCFHFSWAYSWEWNYCVIW